jgi:hypothetical protein
MQSTAAVSEGFRFHGGRRRGVATWSDEESDEEFDHDFYARRFDAD